MTHTNTPVNRQINTQINQERMEAILHLAGQVDLQITKLSEEMASINIRLDSLRALSAQIFNVQDGTLSDEEVHALAQSGKEADGGEGNPTPEYIVDEIIADEITTSPE